MPTEMIKCNKCGVPLDIECAGGELAHTTEEDFACASCTIKMISDFCKSASIDVSSPSWIDGYETARAEFGTDATQRLEAERDAASEEAAELKKKIATLEAKIQGLDVSLDIANERAEDARADYYVEWEKVCRTIDERDALKAQLEDVEARRIEEEAISFERGLRAVNLESKLAEADKERKAAISTYEAMRYDLERARKLIVKAENFIEAAVMLGIETCDAGQILKAFNDFLEEV